jgi:hypothetical protein
MEQGNPMSRIALMARLGRRPEMREIAKRLEKLGHKTCSSWVWNDSEDDGLTIAEKLGVAITNADNLESAGVAIAFTESPPMPPGSERGGRHADFGYALAVCKRVLVCGPRENIAHWHPKVEQVDSVAELLTLLRERP